MAAMRIMVRIAIAIRALIQIGDNTHHQDQLITLVSLRQTNNTVSRPGSPIPLEDEEEDEDILVSFVK